MCFNTSRIDDKLQGVLKEWVTEAFYNFGESNTLNTKQTLIMRFLDFR